MNRIPKPAGPCLIALLLVGSLSGSPAGAAASDRNRDVFVRVDMERATGGYFFGGGAEGTFCRVRIFHGDG